MDDVSGVGSGVLIAIAAALWLVYLVPSWLRKHQYEATERNAVRLQQTLRVLAETAEVPTAVRAEATARAAREQEKIMRDQERLRAAAAKAAVQRPPASAATRLRRTRLITALVLVAGVAFLIAQLPAAFTTGIAGGTALALAVASIVIIAAIAMLRRLSAVSRARTVHRVAIVPERRRVVTSSSVADAAPAAVKEWTPVPVPKPLYLSRSMAPTPAAVDAGALARAAREAEEALRAAQEAPEVAPIRSQPAAAASAAPAAGSRFAAMGRIDEGELGATDLDEVLRRRRAAG